MSLQTELNAVQAAWRQRAGDDVATTIAADNEALLRSGLVARALQAGAKFPDLRLPNARGGQTRIYDVLARGPLVVTFYRGGWCPYCNLELRAYQSALGDIRALGAELIAISPEAPNHTLSTAEKNDLTFEILSDVNGVLEDALGIRFDLSDPIVALYKRFGRDLPSHNGDAGWSLPVPATYVLDRDGRIVLAFVDPDYRRRLEPAATIEALHKIKVAETT
ncbi:MAG TPA: peroxiredoxin-like family protein [Casimicrobiaceae bacterium]|nr:peroxiredoxin-like family protein [Casimicrobiaceae bacterium]